MAERDSGLANVRHALEQKLGRPLRPDEFDVSEGIIGSFYVRVDGGKLTEFTPKDLRDSNEAIGLHVARKIASALHRERAATR